MDAPTIEPDKFLAWGKAVGAMFTAQQTRTPETWTAAAKAWEALASLFTPNEGDRNIFVGLAEEARAHAGERR
jgi:hypothetical protein